LSTKWLRSAGVSRQAAKLSAYFSTSLEREHFNKIHVYRAIVMYHTSLCIQSPYVGLRPHTGRLNFILVSIMFTLLADLLIFVMNRIFILFLIIKNYNRPLCLWSSNNMSLIREFTTWNTHRQLHLRIIVHEWWISQVWLSDIHFNFVFFFRDVILVSHTTLSYQRSAVIITHMCSMALYSCFVKKVCRRRNVFAQMYLAVDTGRNPCLKNTVHCSLSEFLRHRSHIWNQARKILQWGAHPPIVKLFSKSSQCSS
jgi:hypothetical protein